MIDAKEKTYLLVINNREKLTVNGVMNVESFGEEYLVLNTALGELTVEGSGLKIESLTKDSGEIFIVGKISSLYYKDQKSEKGLFKRIFK